MQKPKIERGIPIPGSKRTSYVGNTIYPTLDKMKPGDSAEFLDAKRRQVANAAYHRLGAGNYVVRGKRIWRIK